MRLGEGYGSEYEGQYRVPRMTPPAQAGFLDLPAPLKRLNSNEVLFQPHKTVSAGGEGYYSVICINYMLRCTYLAI